MIMKEFLNQEYSNIASAHFKSAKTITSFLGITY